METVTLSKQEYPNLKSKTDMDEELLQELVQGLKDIKAGNVKRAC